MKTPLRSWAPLVGLWLWAGISSKAQAQCTAAATTTFTFNTTAASGNWKNRAPQAAPAGSTITTIGTSGYASSDPASLFTTGGINGTTMLAWQNDYPDNQPVGSTAPSSTVIFNFNRPVSGLTIRLQDVDNGIPGYTDEVTFAGSNNGATVTPTLSRPTGSTVLITGVMATGTTSVGDNTAGTVTATYPGSVTSITLTYRNTTGGTTPSVQLVGIDQITWCRAAPVANNVTNATALASTAGQTDIDSPVVAADGGTIASYTITQLPPGNEGTLYYDAGLLGGGYRAVTAGQTITTAQMASIRFDPADTYSGGNSVFSYTATDDAGLVSNGATFTIPIQAVAGPVGCGSSYLDGTARSGLTAEYYNGYFADNFAYFENRTPNLRRADAQLEFTTNASFGNLVTPAGAGTGSNANPDAFSARYRGSIYIPTTGSYTFFLNSDDASYLWLDAAALASTPTAASAVVNNGGGHSLLEKSGSVTLTAGLHNIMIFYGDNTADNALTLSYAGPGISKQVVPNSALCAGRGNLPPVATAINYTLPAIGYNLAALSGSDPDGSVANFTIVALPANGTLALNGTAVIANQVVQASDASNLTFTPNAGYSGTTSFTYFATDNQGMRSVTAATYTINAPNRPPVVANDSRDVPLNTTVSGNVVLNDYDQEQNIFTVALGTAPAHGTVILNSNGTYSYTPTTGYTGPDSFTYTACDNSTPSMCSAAATVNLRVFSTSTACTSATGNNLLVNPAFTNGNTGFTTTYRYVAAGYTIGNNATGIYPEGTYAVGTNAATYHPNFVGTGHTGGTNDNFLMVNGAASIRTLYAQTVTVQPGRYYTFSAFFNNLLAPSSNGGVPELGFVINGESVSGTITLNESPDQWVQFSDVWFSGTNTTATFEIRNVSTAVGGNDLAVDDVYFGSCNLAPTAVADAVTITSGSNATLNILANDIDPENSFNAATVDLNPNQAGIQPSITTPNGTFSVNTSGVVTFVPVAGFVGTAVTPYLVQDAAGAPTNQANIAVTVQQPTADLAVAITAPANATTATAGQALTFTVQTTNNGAAAATGVVPTLQLPAGLTGPGPNGALTFANGGSYNSSTGLVTFPTTSVNSGSNVSNSVSFLVPATGPFTGAASVTATTADAITTNNNATATVNVTPSFDLTTTLSGPAAAGTGTGITYTVVTRNSGPSPATNVAQAVTLPGNQTGLFLSNNGTYAYNSTNNTTVVTFPSLGMLAAGQTVSNTISLTAPTAAGTFTPTASVSATGEAVTNNNTSAVATTISTTSGMAANVYSAVGVTSGGTAVTNVAPGTALLVTATATNAGEGAATGVVQQLTLPAGLSAASLTISGNGSYNPTTGIVTWPSTSLVAGAAQTNTVRLAAPAAGPLLFDASASTTSADVVVADNVASAIVTVRPTTDVATTISGPTTVTAGQRVTYTVTTTNTSTVPASNVQQFVSLPPGATNLTYTSNLGPNTTGTVDAQPNQGLLAYPAISSLAPGQSVTNVISFDAPAGSYSATAFLTTTTPDNVAANNTSTVVATSTRASDVAATIAGPDVVIQGTPVVYTVRTVNNGTAPAASLTTTVQLPTDLTTVVVRDAAGAIIAGAYNATTGVVTFPTRTEVPVGDAGSMSNTITFSAPDVSAISVTAVANMPTSTNDLARTNNTATYTTSVLRATSTAEDLSVAVRASTTSVAAGQSVTFTLTTTNNSTTTAPAVVQRMALPMGLNPATLTISNAGTYDPTTGIVTFPTVTSLASGAAAALTNTIVVTAPGTGPLTAVASVSGGNSDGVATNNTALATVAVTSVSNVRAEVRSASLQTTPLENTVLPGQAVTYLVRVINDGPSLATGVSATAQIPTNLDPATVIISGGGSYDPATGLVTFPAVGALSPGQAASVGYTITFRAPTTGASYTVAATAATNTTQSSTGDDTQTYRTTLSNQVPVANTVVNSLTAPDGNTSATALPISALSATDVDGTISIYAITSLPNATAQGVLFYAADGVNYSPVALTNGRFVLTAATAGNLRFDPVSSFVGNAFFTFTATDNTGAASAPALYSIPVGLDNAATYASGVVKGGTGNAYQNGDLITAAFDANGGEYSFSSATSQTTMTDTGIRSATTDAAGTNLLSGMGLTLNATTGRISVSNRSLLRSGDYVVNVTTIDEFGGTTTQPVRFTIGGAPLPVSLVRFEARSQGKNALLTWETAQELYNDHFEVERSVDGVNFEKAGQVAGRGTTTATQQYTYTDAVASRLAKTLYYRLRQVDTDGKASSSQIRVVTFGPAEEDLVIFPNPASSVLHVRLTAEAPQATLAVYTTTGVLVMQQTLDASLSATLDVSQLATGAYLVKVQTASGATLVRRFLKE
ncbi:Ig-like domain-containing protein [Hymenobacter mucosus]|uniref:Conserved repeat domain-containing protein/Por secretion system C-terminal sorting domain-containing protein n=1 Tax=Hymenobacter mucosus TaxID=1411120 RepID=A0A238VYY5_9BACT|nr:Ig-like domain-containing protein [Hymenobacter mucosus]SNR39476.1 conserved repeat domain-containing protein/Por secretion system C-terminal sorting domain-containing protein [Hymenobacter mucosus]